MLHRDIATGKLAREHFDFWIGVWELRWTTPEGHPRAGTNVVTKELGDSVVVERFSDPIGSDGRGYHGLSVSSYDDESQVWRQTWVDSEGAHMSFTGGRDGDRMVMARSVEVDGVDVEQRMVWRGIEADRLIWDWERSTDSGATWRLVWRIDYARVSD